VVELQTFNFYILLRFNAADALKIKEEVNMSTLTLAVAT
jgi:hypothetical protein